MLGFVGARGVDHSTNETLSLVDHSSVSGFLLAASSRGARSRGGARARGTRGAARALMLAPSLRGSAPGEVRRLQCRRRLLQRQQEPVAWTTILSLECVLSARICTPTRRTLSAKNTI